ncbi:MAG: lactate utilization protein [Rhodospirillaceae bacterium]
MSAEKNMRRAILDDLKRALGPDDGVRRQAVADRLSAKARHLTPKRGQLEGTARIDWFQSEAERVNATVQRVNSIDAVPQAIADYLAAQNMPASIRMTPDPRLKTPAWNKTALSISEGPATGDDTAGVSHAFAGVAETGTLVFTSGPDSPNTVNYLPPAHIAVIRAADIEGCYEDAWAKLRSMRAGTEASGGFMPRTVNWITGPSRTADIELTLFLGIHGPKNLHIIVIEDD